MNNQETDNVIFDRIINEIAELSIVDDKLQHKQIVFFFSDKNEFHNLAISNGNQVLMYVGDTPSQAIAQLKKYKEALSKGNNPQAYKIKQKKK
jgi:hypothetical protein